MSADRTESFLEAFHAEHPGCTWEIFGDARADGRSSYERLAELVVPGQAVLDLGCGGGELLELAARRGAGALVGVELSDAELERARSRPGLADARLLLARADEAELVEPGSMDLVLSHLSLSLMHRLEAVLDQARRALRPSGRFAAVLPAGLPAAGGLRVFAEVFTECLEHSRTGMMALGEPVAHDLEALVRLIEERLGAVAERESFIVRTRAPAAVLADRLLGMYNVGFLDDEGRGRLRKQPPLRLTAMAEADGTVEFEAPLLRVTVPLRPPAEAAS